MGQYYICRVYVVYPDEFHNGLWGGEGVVKGMLKRQAKRKRKNQKIEQQQSPLSRNFGIKDKSVKGRGRQRNAKKAAVVKENGSKPLVVVICGNFLKVKSNKRYRF